MGIVLLITMAESNADTAEDAKENLWGIEAAVYIVFQNEIIYGLVFLRQLHHMYGNAPDTGISGQTALLLLP